eukprot:gene2193-2057_t
MRTNVSNCTASKNQIFVYRGIDENNETSNCFQIFELNKKDFRKLPNEVIPPLSCHCSIADGDKIYIYGGLDSFGVAQNKLYSYNIKSDRLKEE